MIENGNKGKGKSVRNPYEEIYLAATFVNRFYVFQTFEGDEFFDYLKTKADAVVEEKVKNMKELHRILYENNERDKILLLVGQDHMLKETNTKFDELISIFTDDSDKQEIIFPKIEPFLKDFYKHRIEGFDSYIGRLVMTTTLGVNSVDHYLLDRCCYHSNELIQELVELKRSNEKR
ncbi:MAG: hypothetical protein ACLFR1_16050 [Spirochaetia bacterium]